MRVQSVFVLQVCALLIFLPPASLSEVTCDALLIMAANASSLQPWSTWNETQNNGSGRVIGSGLYCDASVDGIGTCWPRSAAGHMVSRPCPEMFYGVRYNTTNSVYRKCLANGTWAAKGNYSMCKAILHQEEHPLPEEHHPLEPHRRLHPQEHHVVRGAAHNEPRGARKQRGVVPPGYGFLQLLPLHQLLLDVWGRVLPAHRHRAHLLHRQAAQVDVHLHRLVCWFGKRAGVYTDYIYQGPMILVLVINFIFLFNIVRILMTKLRASTTSETIQYRKAVKATLVLLPLLGITYMLFFVNPGEDEISQIVFIYFNSFLESFQGFFVSVFYCFLNSEVRSAARKRFHRWQEQHSIRARMTQAMSIPTSPSRVSFHSIKQSTSL
ncbi:corticotropin-releasing factor receptor 1 isoform X2 [Dunckerocampus dactyliophorus]|uniref:corticotropin-releasing factor receptor 1 isoform X2 n=1 Tax=Dunckerocampus dactyliophorus TaxID=161453 RepID=UPI00240694F7|nr:corticotropin-releasing factor receptor 1 isoform X2 [Dunckerocampus dactyliophorus]